MGAPTPTAVVQGAEIPSVPRVLREILDLAGNPDASSKDLEARIMQEPGLVTHLLKTVNSAAYAMRQEVTSVNHAVVLLGFLAVKSLVSGLALIDTFHNLPGLNQDYVLTVWGRSLASAGLVRTLGRSLDRERRDELYLGAMVQDVGRLVLSQHYQDRYDALVAARPFAPPAAERKLLGIDHPAVGAALLHEWGFAERTVHLVAGHHAPGTYPGDPLDLHLLHMANTLAGRTDLEGFLDRPPEAVEAPILAGLEGLDWTWEELRDDRATLVDSVAQARQLIQP